MELSTDGGLVIRSPSASQIEEALGSLDSGSDGYAILEANSGTYMQAAGDRRTGFILEYQEGDTDRHFKATRDKIPLAEVVKAFQMYAAGDMGWRGMFEWERVEISKWSGRGWLGAAVILIVLVVIWRLLWR